MNEVSAVVRKEQQFLVGLEQATKLFAVSASASLSLSVFYDYCFLQSLDLNFGDVSTTISDHVRSAIVWAPPVLVSLGIWAAVFFFNVRLDEASTGDSPRWLPRPAKVYAGIALIGLGLSTIEAFISGLPEAYGFPLASLLWVSLYWFVAPKSLSVIAQLAIFIIPAVFIAIGASGFASGSAMLRAKDPHWALVLKEIAPTVASPRLVFGMRRFASNTVVIGANHQVMVVASELIVEAKAITDSERTVSRGCRWFKFHCETTLPVAQPGT